jgi:hypothetical protein
MIISKVQLEFWSDNTYALVLEDTILEGLSQDFAGLW